MSDKAPTARALARETVRARILAAARARLTEEGPAQLSLRAVARDVGLVSSAVYRYFASRDDLLTALLVADYDELGAAVESAEAPVDRRPPRPLDGGVPGDPDVGDLPPRRLRTALRLTRARLRRTAGHDRAGLAHHARARPHRHDAWSGPDGAAPRIGTVPAVGDPVRTAAAIADAVAYTRQRGFHADPPPEAVLRLLMAWTTVFGGPVLRTVRSRRRIGVRSRRLLRRGRRPSSRTTWASCTAEHGRTAVHRGVGLTGPRVLR